MQPIPVRAAARALISAAIVSLLLGLVLTARATASVTLANWDAAQQRQVVGARLMGTPGRPFRGALRLSAADANRVLTALTALSARLQGGAAQAAAHPVHTARGPVTVVAFDAMLVQQLGLADVASHVQSVAVAAGLNPPAYFGSEVVARYLGLRYNHPAGTDSLELFPSDAITRAEAAWSLSQVLGFADWNVSSARDALSGFELPSLTAGERQALSIAVSRIGYPYVWGGTTDDTSDGLAHGGFDCSGFAWRVFKLSGLRSGRAIQGRTAAQQAGEIPRTQRVPASRLQPGDLLFFGSAQFTSRASEANIIHEGIYLGDNWVIHSSSQGVYVLPLQGSWLGELFAWGRAVIH